MHMQRCDPILTCKQLAQKLNVSQQSVRRMFRDGRLPPPENPECRKGIFWKTESIQDWETMTAGVERVAAKLRKIYGDPDVHWLAREHASVVCGLIENSRFPILAREQIARATEAVPYRNHRKIASREKQIEKYITNARCVYRELARRHKVPYRDDGKNSGHLRLKKSDDVLGPKAIVFDPSEMCPQFSAVPDPDDLPRRL